MLLTTGIIALSRKVADDRAKKRESKQNQLRPGEEVAKRAFAAQTSRMIEGGGAGISHAGTDMKYEDPDDIVAISPDAASPDTSSKTPDLYDARRTSQLDLTLGPVKSEKATHSPSSSYTETPTSPVSSRGVALNPPPYSARAGSSMSPSSPSTYSRISDSSTSANSDTKSLASVSVDSTGTHAIRVKTKGANLKSGFPYHPALFELHVAPDKWDGFTAQIAETAKLEKGDYARMWGAATATAMTGAIGTSIFVGKSMNRSLQEKRVKEGLANMSAGGLGDTLLLWNEEYFNQLGLLVHLELSESTAKDPDQKPKTFRKPALFYSNQEDRERKRDERKFMIVVTKLEEEAKSTEASEEVVGTEALPAEMEGTAIVEIGSSDVPGAGVVELPGDDAMIPVELPAGVSLGYGKKDETPVEMDSDNTYLLEKLDLVDRMDESPTASENNSTSWPLPASHSGHDSSMNKETT